MAPAPESYEEIIAIISEFNFENVNQEWTNQIWTSNFNETQPLADELREEIMDGESMPRLFINCSVKVRRFVAQNLETPLWATLAESGRLKPFIAFLYYIIDCGRKKNASTTDKRNGLLAADTYVSLCAIKGGNAYHVFSASLFQQSLEMLKIIATALYQRPVAASNRGGRGRGRGRGAAAAVQQARRSSSISTASSSNHDDPADEVNTDDVRTFLKTLWLFVGQYSLVDNAECIDSLSSSLCRLLTITSDGNESTARAERENDLSTRSPASVSFAILHKLFETDNNDHVMTIARAVFKHLLPYLLMVSPDGRHVASATIPVALVQLRDLAKNFVKDLLETNPDGVAKAVYVILQHICVKVTDKADYRAKVSQLIIELAQALPNDVFQQFLRWLIKYSRNTKIGLRAFALDIVLSLFVDTSKKVVNLDATGQTESKELLELCLHLILGRCSDKAGTVRNRALVCLTRILEDTAAMLRTTIDHDGEPNVVKRVLSEFVSGTAHAPDVEPEDEEPTLVAEPNGELPEESNAGGDGVMSAESNNGTESNGDERPPESNGAKEQPANGNAPPKSPAQQKTVKLLALLLRRCNDDKTMVRKAAMNALECLIIIVPQCFNEEAATVFRHRCMDTALSVRKQALESMTNLLLQRRDDLLAKSWLMDVLALIVDRETTVQEKCRDAFHQAITSKLVEGDDDGERAWRLVELITKDGTTTRYAQRILQELRKKDLISARIMRCIESATTQPARSTAAWFLLSEMADHSDFDLKRLQDAWRSGSLAGNVFNYAAKILTVKAGSLSKDMLRYFTMDLKARVERFLVPSENIAAALTAMWQFMQTGATTGFDDWCEIMAKECVQFLSPIAFPDHLNGRVLTQTNDELIIRHLFLLGELFQLSAAWTVNDENFYMMLGFVAADKYAEIVSRPGTDLGRRSGMSNSQNQSQRSQHQHQLSTDQSANLSTSEHNASQAAAAASNHQPTQSSMINNTSIGSDISPNVRSHAVIAWGKLCLLDERYAKKAVAVLVSELDSPSADFTIRNNIVVVLSDLCVRYTSLIDCHLVRISRLLRDASALVRKQTLTLLTNLLKEDYIKWRGALLFRFLTCLLDADPQIRAFAEFCLVNILLQRQPMMFYMHFLECLFYFNDTRNPMWCSSVDMVGEEKEEFALAGYDNQMHRLYLYRFMISHFTDEQRFRTSERICHKVLGAIADEAVALDSNSDQVVADSLIVLACKEMKLTSLSSSGRSAAAGDDDLDDAPMADPNGVAIAEQTKKMISHTVKMYALEHMIPTLLSLKVILQEKQLLRSVRLLKIYLTELCKDYKDEMKEFLAADKVLHREIEYDLKQQEKGAAPIQLPHRLI